jgi:hypothetical protein
MTIPIEEAIKQIELEELYQKALDDVEYLRAVNRGLKDELAISNDIRYKQHLKIVELGVPNGAY